RRRRGGAAPGDRPHRDVQGGVRPVRPPGRHPDRVQRGAAGRPLGHQYRQLWRRLAVRPGRKGPRAAHGRGGLSPVPGRQLGKDPAADQGQDKHRRGLTEAMSRQKLTVVLSQAQGKNPTKRALEESIAAALILEPGLDVSIVPYLYDLDPEHTGRLFLESVQGDMVVLAWMYPRAAFWLLDRDGIKGNYGESKLRAADAGADEDEEG